MSDENELVARVGSRICHDLVSPLGAIGNGLELMLLTGAEESPEMQLVQESLAGATARIWFFRLAFGAADAGAMVRERELAQALAALGSRNLTVDWTVPGEVTRPEAKLALLAINCLERALPYGGTIRVSQTGDAWEIIASSDRLNKIAADWDYVTGDNDTDPLEPAKIQFALIGPEAKFQGRTLDLSETEKSLTIRF